MTQLSKVKQNTHEHKDKSSNQKNTKRQTQGPTGLCELFLLTVPIEEVARCQYKTVKIIFSLNKTATGILFRRRKTTPQVHCTTVICESPPQEHQKKQLKPDYTRLNCKHSRSERNSREVCYTIV